MENGKIQNHRFKNQNRSKILNPIKPTYGKSAKVAVFLNALILPGIGHIYIGYKVRGVLLALATLFFIVAPLAKYAFLIAYALNTTKAEYANPSIYMLKALQLVWPDVSNIFILAIIAIFIIWIYGIYDVYVKCKKGAGNG